jgi:hypothetical protein
MCYLLHIETAPFAREVIVAKAPVFKAASNIKDPAKIAEDIAKKVSKYVEEAQFNEATASVCAISITDEETLETETVTMQTKTEEQMLRWLFDKISGVCTVTFKGAKYVYPFLSRRGAIYGINFFAEVFYIGYTGRLLETHHMDIAKTWACGSLSQPESIKELTDVLGVSYEEPTRPYHQLLTEEKYEEAESQLLEEVRALREVHSILTKN